MKYLPFFLIVSVVMVSFSAQAQLSSQKEAAYLATLKAVMDYKINDEENISNMDKLRQDQKFKDKLIQNLSQLSNDKHKDSKQAPPNHPITKRGGFQTRIGFIQHRYKAHILCRFCPPR